MQSEISASNTTAYEVWACEGDPREGYDNEPYPLSMAIVQTRARGSMNEFLDGEGTSRTRPEGGD